MTEKGYQDTIELDAKVTRLLGPLLLELAQSSDVRKASASPVLAEAFVLLEAISSQEVNRTIKKLALPSDMHDDMMQEAFIKFREAVLFNFNTERCPVFVTFWRRSLHKHLLSKYYTKNKPMVALAVDPPADPTPDKEHRELIDELVARYVSEFTRDFVKDRAIAIAILTLQIFPKDEPVGQPTIARMFNVTQGYISKWQAWMEKKIRDENSHLFSD